MSGDPAWDYLHQRRFDVRLRALANRLYQQERQRRFELLEGGVKVLSLVAGSVAFWRVATDPEVVKWAAAVLFVLTAMSLVFGWGNKARDGARRASEWATLERDIEAAGERGFTEQQLAEWFARCNEIEIGEPPQHRILWERCYLRATKTLGGTPSIGGPPTWWPVIVLH